MNVGTIRVVVLMLCVLTNASFVLAEEYRSWQRASGSRWRIRMAAVGVSGNSVRFKRKDNGREFNLPLSRLSAADQRYIREKFGDLGDAANIFVSVRFRKAEVYVQTMAEVVAVEYKRKMFLFEKAAFKGVGDGRFS